MFSRSESDIHILIKTFNSMTNITNILIHMRIRVFRRYRLLKQRINRS